MSKSKITKTIDYLSEPKKGITAAVLLVLAIVAVVFVWRKIKGGTSGSSPLTLMGDVAIEQNTGTNITDSTDFAHLVVRLWNATVPPGTDENEVYAVLNCLNTQADYMKLCNSWMRYWSSASWLSRLHAQSSVPAQLQYDLSSSELAKARNILLNKGITPDF